MNGEYQPLTAEEIEHMNGFWEWLKSQPKPSIYKPSKVVKVHSNATISKLRDLGHKYFDMIWRDLKLVERNELYGILADWLDIPEPKAHFTFLNPEECISAIEFSIQFLNNNRRLDLDFGAPEPTPYFELIIVKSR